MGSLVDWCTVCGAQAVPGWAQPCKNWGSKRATPAMLGKAQEEPREHNAPAAFVTMSHYGLSMSFHNLDTLVLSGPGPSL